jgi:hypothetical protein
MDDEVRMYRTPALVVESASLHVVQAACGGNDVNEPEILHTWHA